MLQRTNPIVIHALRMWKRSVTRVCPKPICPVSTVAIAENIEIRIENNDISGHILFTLFSIRLTLVSRYSAFSSARGVYANVLNGSQNSRLSRERRRMQNNVTRGRGEWRIMQGECDPIYRSLFISHYSLHWRQWKRGITVNLTLLHWHYTNDGSDLSGESLAIVIEEVLWSDTGILSNNVKFPLNNVNIKFHILVMYSTWQSPKIKHYINSIPFYQTRIVTEFEL